MKISLPNDITLEHINYNSKMPQKYFDDLNYKLNKFNIKLNGFIIEEKWKGNKTLTSFTCEGKDYNTYRINKLYRYIRRIEERGYKKPSGFNLTPDLMIKNVTEECINRNNNIEFVGYDEYDGARTYLKLKCNNLEKHNVPYEWNSTAYDSFMNSHAGCPKCNGVHHYTIEELNENIKTKSCENKIKFEPITSESFNGVFSRINLECMCGKKWDMSYDNFIRNRGCPDCSHVSYINGYGNGDFSSNLYVLEVKNENNLIGYKFGIAKDIKKRLSSYKFSSNCEMSLVCCENFINCNDAFNLEKYIKKNIKGRHIPKELFGPGWTETISPEDFKLLIELIQKGA